MSFLIDKVSQFEEPDTITLEQYRRVHGGSAPAPAPSPGPTTCLECGKALRPSQIANRGRFCCHRCAGRHTARREYGPSVVPLPGPEKKETDVGIVHDLIGDEYDVVTGERNDYPLPPRCEQCGMPYQRKRKDQRFCSKDCGSKWHGTHPPADRKPVAGSPADLLLAVIAQVLAAAGEWHVEARLGDITLTARKGPGA